MSGFAPSFLNGSKCVIMIEDRVIAYAQNLNISDDMSLTPVFGIGAFGAAAIEPTGYMARGSLSIQHYSDHILNQNTLAKSPRGLAAGTSSAKGYDGNSMLTVNSFSPAALILSTTVDIVIYERIVNGNTGTSSAKSGFTTTKATTPIYTLKGVRFGSYSLGFTPGSLVLENLSFMAASLIDHKAEGVNATKVEQF